MEVFMEHVSNWIKGICAVIGGALSWLFGDLSGMFYALVAFVVIDYITGVIAAAVQQELNSTIGFKGIAKKVFIFLIVGLAHIIDAYDLGDGDVIRTAAIFFYLSNEGLSIIENSVRIGLPVPKTLKDALERLSEEDEDESK
jgi:toxin secretion/phage lysis holin